MTERLDFSISILSTTIRVTYADITRLTADVLVSSDDVHLSMVGGVGAAIRSAAGDVPREDVQKHTLPLALGAVLPTSAGRLGVKYIFHTVTLDFSKRPQIEALIPLVVQRVLDLAGALGAETLALPLLGTGSAGLPKVPVLEHIVRSLACYAASQARAPREVTIAVYASRAEDHAQAEQKLLGEIEPVRALIAGWASAVEPINTRMQLLRPLLATVSDDNRLREAVDLRIKADIHNLCQVLACPEQAASVMVEQSHSVDSQQEYERAKRRLDAHLADLSEELEHLNQLQRAQKRRLRSLEQQWAQKGGDTPPEIVNEIEDIARAVEQRAQRIQKLTEQQEAAQLDLDLLDQRWRNRPGRQ